MDSWISIAGSVASVGSAGWAYFEARKAARSATRTEEIRSELISRRVMIEVSRIYGETNRVLTSVSRVGPTCTASNLRGVKVDAIAKDVEDYSRLLNEHSNHFSQILANRAKELCDSLKLHIVELAEATEFEQKKEAGKKIYYLIESFLPEVKYLSDNNREL